MQVSNIKCEAATRLLVPTSSGKAIVLFGDEQNGDEADHATFGEHCEIENPVKKTYRDGSEAYVWEQPAGSVENEHWDNLVGCLALASTEMRSEFLGTQTPKTGLDPNSGYAQRLKALKQR